MPSPQKNQRRPSLAVALHRADRVCAQRRARHTRIFFSRGSVHPTIPPYHLIHGAATTDLPEAPREADPPPHHSISSTMRRSPLLLVALPGWVWSFLTPAPLSRPSQPAAVRPVDGRAPPPDRRQGSSTTSSHAKRCRPLFRYVCVPRATIQREGCIELMPCSYFGGMRNRFSAQPRGLLCSGR